MVSAYAAAVRASGCPVGREPGDGVRAVGDAERRIPVLTTRLARAYASLTDRTLLRDVQFLVAMDLVRRNPDTGRFLAHTGLLRNQMPRRA